MHYNFGVIFQQDHLSSNEETNIHLAHHIGNGNPNKLIHVYCTIPNSCGGSFCQVFIVCVTIAPQILGRCKVVSLALLDGSLVGAPNPKGINGTCNRNESQ